MRSGFSETRRQVVHITMGGFALLLRWITWWQAAALASIALLFNAFVLPHTGGDRLYRPDDVARGAPRGILLYPLSVLLLILAFPRRLDLVAAAWGILAAGDGVATLVGRRFGRARLPWNRDKSIAGTAAFVAAGATAGVALAWWVRPAVVPAPSPWFTVGAPVLAAIVAALIESMPVRLDDNISVPAAAALTLWMASLASRPPRDLLDLAPYAATGLVLNLGIALAGWLARTVSPSGAVAGAIIGTVVFAGAGWQGWLLLVAAFAAASITSRLGLGRKTLLGIAEERGGQRGAGNAIANTGLAAGAALLAVLSRHTEASLLALAAALTAGASDTVASEIGKAWGRRTFLIAGFRPVPPGTPGAVSLEGTAAGVVAALALAALAVWLRLIPPAALWIVVVAATAASFIESALGATLEPKGILNNDLLNFITTASAAALALVFASAAGLS
jgi:uncharacterized protein (TIGR00297 family)